jgi:hypothetical protein
MLTTVLPSHADDGAAESFWRPCCRVMLAMALLLRLGHDTMYLLSHAGDGAAVVTWP